MNQQKSAQSARREPRCHERYCQAHQLRANPIWGGLRKELVRKKMTTKRMRSRMELSAGCRRIQTKVCNRLLTSFDTVEDEDEETGLRRADVKVANGCADSAAGGSDPTSNE